MKLTCIGRENISFILMNLIEQIKVNDTSIDGYQGTYYDENPEFVQVTIDSSSKILQGIKSDGTSYVIGDLQVEGQIINSSIQEQIDSAVESMQQTITDIDSVDSFEKKSGIVDYDDSWWKVGTPNYKYALIPITKDYTVITVSALRESV